MADEPEASRPLPCAEVGRRLSRGMSSLGPFRVDQLRRVRRPTSPIVTALRRRKPASICAPSAGGSAGRRGLLSPRHVLSTVARNLRRYASLRAARLRSFAGYLERLTTAPIPIPASQPRPATHSSQTAPVQAAVPTGLNRTPATASLAAAFLRRSAASPIGA